MISGRGGQFDPDIVDAFVAVLTARYPELARRDPLTQRAALLRLVETSG